MQNEIKIVFLGLLESPFFVEECLPGKETAFLAGCQSSSMPWQKQFLEEVLTEMCSSMMVPLHHNTIQEL